MSETTSTEHLEGSGESSSVHSYEALADKLFKVIEALYGHTREDIRSKSRHRNNNLVYCRYTILYIMKKAYPMISEKIYSDMVNRDRAMVYHSVKNINNALDSPNADYQLYSVYQNIFSMVKGLIDEDGNNVMLALMREQELRERLLKVKNKVDSRMRTLKEEITNLITNEGTPIERWKLAKVNMFVDICKHEILKTI